MQYAARRTLFGRDELIGSHEQQAEAIMAMTARIKADDAALRSLLRADSYRLEHFVVDVGSHWLMVLDRLGEVCFSIEYAVEAVEHGA